MTMNTCLDNNYKIYSQHWQHSFKYLFQDTDSDVQLDLCLLSAQGQDQDLVPHLNLFSLTWMNSKISIITHPWGIKQISLKVELMYTRLRKIKKLQMKESLEKNRPYYRGMIDDSKKYSECKIYLLIKPKFMSPTDANEKRMMYS